MGAEFPTGDVKSHKRSEKGQDSRTKKEAEEGGNREKNEEESEQTVDGNVRAHKVQKFHEHDLLRHMCCSISTDPPSSVVLYVNLGLVWRLEVMDVESEYM